MMVAVVVMVIGLGLVVPGFQNLLASQRLSASANDVLAVFNFARMEAVRTRGRVVVCPTLDGSTCAGTDWSSAIVFADTNRDGSLGSGESVARRWDLSGSGLTLSQIQGASPAQVVFGGSGLVRPSAAGGFTQILVCAERLDDKSILVDIGTGGAHSSKGDGNGCS